MTGGDAVVAAVKETTVFLSHFGVRDGASRGEFGSVLNAFG
jgi:hypothetical protein